MPSLTLYGSGVVLGNFRDFKHRKAILKKTLGKLILAISVSYTSRNGGFTFSTEIEKYADHFKSSQNK